MSLAHSKKQLLVYFSILASLALPFTLTLETVKQSMVPPSFASNPTPLGYTVSLLIFLIPIVMFAIWLLRNPQYKIELLAYLGAIAGVLVLGSILDLFFGYSFFEFPNPDAVLGVRLPAFSFATWSWVPDYLPVEEFGFYLFGACYMISLYLWGVLFWFKRYNHPDHRAASRNFDRIVKFNGRTLLLCLALVALGFVVKKLGPYPEGFPGYFTFLVLMAFLPCMVVYDVTKYMINWRAFSFMSFLLLLVSLVYEATLGVPYGWWQYNTRQMLGILITGWSHLPIEAVLLWIAAGFGTVLLFEALRMVLYMGRPAGEALFGVKNAGSRRVIVGSQWAHPALPAYIDNGIGMPVPRGPYVNTKADMANFLVKVDYAKVRAICDRYLNNALGGKIKYIPFLSVVQMTYAKLEGYATDDQLRPMGLLPEDDLVFWIPTIAVRYLFGIPVPSHLAMFPYRLYVNSPYGLSSGREVYGFQKTAGDFAGPIDYKQPEFQLSTLGFKTYDPKQMGQVLPLIRLRKVAEVARDKTFSDAGECHEALFKFLLAEGHGNVVTSGIEDIGKFLVNLLKPETCSVAVKQFRDVVDPLKACMQQIIEAKTRIDRFNGGGLISGEYELEISDLVSEPIAKDLGIELVNGKQRGLYGFWVSTAFTMETGSIIGKS